MSRPFEARDLSLYHAITDVSASTRGAAVSVSRPDAEADSNALSIWFVPFDGGEPRPFTSGHDSDPRWSPDGKELAFVSSRGNGLQLFLMPRGGGEARAVTHMKNGVSSFEWAPDGKSFLMTAKQKVDPSAKGERAEAPEGKQPQVVWRLPYKADGIGYTLDREIHLFTVDKQTGDSKQLTDGPFDVRSARFSPDGQRIAYARTRTGREANRTDVWVMNADGTEAHQVSKHVASVQFPLWSPDGRWIAFTGGEKEGDSSSRLWLIDTKEWSVRPLGEEGLEVESGDSVHWSEDSQSLVFIQVRRGLQEVASISISDGRLDTLVGGERHVLKLAVTQDHLVYAWASMTEPAELWCADRNGGNPRRITDLNGWWRERMVPKVSLRRFEVPDGEGGTEEIEAWLMQPAGNGDGPHPLLLDVHGGPHSVAFLEFRKTMWRHVLVSQGWSVLVPNAVGSSSYGPEFAQRLIGRWGELDLPQHLAAIRTLQEEGAADDRLAVYGKSYGGYLSAWAITQTDAFKAAVVSAPVANIESHFGTSDSGFYVTPFAMCGEPFVNRETARKLSPLVHMHKARTPTLLLQGKDDQRCPIGQSEEIFATLMRSSDVATEMVLYPGEDHHLAEEGRPSFRIDYVERIVAWADQWANRREASHSAPPEKKIASSSGGRGSP